MIVSRRQPERAGHRRDWRPHLFVSSRILRPPTIDGQAFRFQACIGEALPGAGGPAALFGVRASRSAELVSDPVRRRSTTTPHSVIGAAVRRLAAPFRRCQPSLSSGVYRGSAPTASASCPNGVSSVNPIRFSPARSERPRETTRGPDLQPPAPALAFLNERIAIRKRHAPIDVAHRPQSRCIPGRRRTDC